MDGTCRVVFCRSLPSRSLAPPVRQWGLNFSWRKMIWIGSVSWFPRRQAVP